MAGRRGWPRPTIELVGLGGRQGLPMIGALLGWGRESGLYCLPEGSPYLADDLGLQLGVYRGVDERAR